MQRAKNKIQQWFQVGMIGLWGWAASAETAPHTGYAQTAAYRDAISGHHPSVMDEPIEVRQVVELATFNRPYTRFRGSRNTIVFDHVKNVSDFSYISTSSQPTTQAVFARGRQLSAAWGYLFDSFAWEGEIYLPKGFDYVGAPVLTSGANFTYATHVQQTAFYSNLNWMIWEYRHIQPYVSFGVGAAVKLFYVVESGNVTGMKHYFGVYPAWNTGVGLAIQLSKNAGIDVSYRHMDLGHTKLHAANKTDHVKLKSTSEKVQGYAVGIFWRY